MEGWRQQFQRKHPMDDIPKTDREFAEGLISRFKTQNPLLMKLNPEVGINYFTHDYSGNPCKFFILMVGHKYIFDYRLLPTHFENIEVKSHLCEKMPKEFPAPFPGMQNEEYLSPDRFLLFVNRNIEKIRIGLKSESLSVKDALDAITGDFDKHKKWIKQLKCERIMENKEHIDFFNKLLEKTNLAYLKSDIYKSHGHKNWGYSVSSTCFEKNAKVIVGFNWGVDNSLIKNGNSHCPQKEYPLKSYSSLYDELGSFKRTFNLFHNYFETIPEIQTNYCFFRSENESQITNNDLELSNDLFDELIEYLNPSMLISFSKSLNCYFESTGRLVHRDLLEIKSGNRIFQAVKGNVNISNRVIKYFNLPHPNYPITKKARTEAWEYCFKNLNG